LLTRTASESDEITGVTLKPSDMISDADQTDWHLTALTNNSLPPPAADAALVMQGSALVSGCDQTQLIFILEAISYHMDNLW